MSKGGMIETVTLTRDEVGALLAAKIAYKFEAHSFRITLLSWPVCASCGLMALKNRLTAEAMKLGCGYSYHSAWASKVRTLGRPK